ncbi:MAG: stage III sporulation protein AG [Clostridia bacterium]|nr:stage III sporulation protein AG [Clostridia bacterium]NLS85877.1 stage III sporulation protein AG [Oscillospiraceae bacterium]
MEIIKKLPFKEILKKKNTLFIIGLAGILLIFMSDFFASDKKAVKSESDTVSSEEYTNQLEAKLITLIESVDGAGKAKVMITLESESESIYAKNETHETQTDEASSSESYKSEHVIISASGGDAPLVETVLSPEIKGVAVVCEGGDDISVTKRIVDLTSVVLGLSTNRICVTKMI